MGKRLSPYVGGDRRTIRRTRLLLSWPRWQLTGRFKRRARRRLKRTVVPPSRRTRTTRRRWRSKKCRWSILASERNAHFSAHDLGRSPRGTHPPSNPLPAGATSDAHRPGHATGRWRGGRGRPRPGRGRAVPPRLPVADGRGGVALASVEREPTDAGTGRGKESDVAQLSEDVCVLSDRLGTVFATADQLRFDRIVGDMSADRKCEDRAENNPTKNFMLEFDPTVMAAERAGSNRTGTLPARS